jgi:gluconolactonase
MGLGAAILVGASCGGDGAAIDGGAGRDATAGGDAGSAADAGNPLDGIGTVELVGDGYMFVEGPVWRPATGDLLFSDIPADTIYRLTPPSSVEPFRSPSGMSNGLALDIDGRLLAAEHGNRRVSRTEASGDLVALATSYQGLSLNSPNDLAVRSDGTIYFTDPPYGIDPQDQELSFNGVFRIAPGGDLTAEWQGPMAARPNGVALSPDEQTLYIADTLGVVRAHPVATDGSLGGPSPLISDSTGADGMAVDVDGNLYVTTSDGVRVYAADGSPWGTIPVPQQPANCTFGGADRRTLYITARTALYRVSVAIPGL